MITSDSATSNETNITDEGELQRTLLSLACGKPGTRILIKEPKGKEINPSCDIFQFDENFTNKLYRIKINTIQVSSPPPSPLSPHEPSLSLSLISFFS